MWMLSIVRRYSIGTKALRNIGIIAHIDAGKTTTTERILFDCGKISVTGEVDNGTTVTDYLDQERQRGISIMSAVATVKWKEHNINIIDTPGHVDFTLEVERALTVLDGSVTIIDGTKGVEAQTQTVWHQAQNHKIPNIFYINKFDRKTADFKKCLSSIMKKLPNIIPLLIHLPYFCPKTGNFSGIIDIVNLKLQYWDISKQTSKGILTECYTRKISDSDQFFNFCLECRLELIGTLADLDDGLIRNEFLILDNPAMLIPSKLIQETLRKVVLSAKVSPVLIGSSRMNIGVTNILDAVVDYLPSPTDKKPPYQFENLASHPDYLSALAFKVIHDKFRGPLTFLRLYSGTLKANMKLKNLTRSLFEKVEDVMQMTGDHYTEITESFAGNIIVVSGLKESFTGDVLIDDHMPHLSSEEVVSNLIPIPKPVVYSAIEAYGLSEIQLLEKSLSELLKEDPSLVFYKDEDTNQFVIGGMGNLHLEVILERIRTEYKLPRTKLGKLRIAYKETPSEDTVFPISYEHSENCKIHGKDIKLSLSFEVEHFSDIAEKGHINLKSTQYFAWSQLDPKLTQLIKSSISRSLDYGGNLLRCPLTGVSIAVKNFVMEPKSLDLTNKTALPVVRSFVVEATRALCKKIKTDLMEPFMWTEISFPDAGISTSDYVSKILSDMNKRRAQIISIESSGNNAVIDYIAANIPLAETFNYSQDVRTLTSGHASIHISFSKYIKVTAAVQDNIVKKKMYRF